MKWLEELEARRQKSRLIRTDLPAFFSDAPANIGRFLQLQKTRVKTEPDGSETLFIRGRRHLPVVYFVHGLGATWRFFYEGILLFEQLGFGVLAHSRLGENSEWKGELTLEGLSTYEAEFIRRYAGGRPVHIIASSFGGILSLLTANRSPQVRSVITIGSFLHLPWTVGHDLIRDFLGNIRLKRIPAKDLGPFAPPVRFIRKRSEDVMNFVLHEYETFPQVSLVSYLDLLKKTDYRRNPPPSSARKLFIHGMEDDMVPLTALEILKTAYPGAETEVLPECAHGPFLSVPVDLYRRIFRFLLTWFF